MKNKCWTFGILGVFTLLIYAFSEVKNIPMSIVVPKGWSKPVYDFAKNPLTEAGFVLGRQLFYDPKLSRDGTISCASCHLQATGFAHIDHDLSHGIEGRIGTRNAMAIVNLAWNTSFMWDGGITHLDVQALAPLANTTEMDETWTNILQKLNASEKYKRLFYRFSGDSLATGQKTLLAFSQFLLQLQSYNAKYDKFIRQESGGEFSEQERNGLQLFRTHCASCHREPLFTNQQFENNGLPIDSTLNDYGRMRITQRPTDSLQFKVPTLRNIQVTYPYMHDGRFRKLREVLNHYTSTQQLKMPITLNSNQKTDLIAFLFTLTDSTFLRDKRFGFPRNE
jgi:cytochrome c peroxidase